MKRILVLGAGRSSGALIEYLLKQSVENNWTVMIADQSQELIREKSKDHPRSECTLLNFESVNEREAIINQADLVISLLPPDLHAVVAECCLKQNRSMLTASYVSPEIQKMGDFFREKGLIVLMECGLDPGLDHMSAMKEIAEIQNKGACITAFRSYTGGLVAPESDTNPWHYKFTWNPRNVILAGQGTVKYLENKQLKYIPYHQLFSRAVPFTIGNRVFEGYANRDSLAYLNSYQLSGVETFIRGTLRIPPFCRAWDVLVQLGMTSDSFIVENSASLTWKDFVESFLPTELKGSIRERVAAYLDLSLHDEVLDLLEWTGLFEEVPLDLVNFSPADILLKLFEKKWKLNVGDRDQIIMYHQIDYCIGEEYFSRKVALTVEGDETYSAMAKTVGLPLAIAAKLILQGRIPQRGVVRPIYKEIYEPVLKELESLGIAFYVVQ